MVPVYPLTLIPATFGEALMAQFPTRAASKKATSLEPGTVEPPDPPDVVDQLAVLLQFPGADATQYRLAASDLFMNRIRQIAQTSPTASPRILGVLGRCTSLLRVVNIEGDGRLN
jgi:hypothetical protein